MAAYHQRHHKRPDYWIRYFSSGKRSDHLVSSGCIRSQSIHSTIFDRWSGDFLRQCHYNVSFGQKIDKATFKVQGCEQLARKTGQKGIL
jgi:hypothetical protein